MQKDNAQATSRRLFQDLLEQASVCNKIVNLLKMTDDSEDENRQCDKCIKVEIDTPSLKEKEESDSDTNSSLNTASVSLPESGKEREELGCTAIVTACESMDLERNDTSITLWQFLFDLLNSGQRPDLIQWTNPDHQDEFKLLDAEGVAQLWGQRKSKPTMNYDKLSRALRYYYDKNIIRKVIGKKFVYCFVKCNETMLLMKDARPRSNSIDYSMSGPPHLDHSPTDHSSSITHSQRQLNAQYMSDRYTPQNYMGDIKGEPADTEPYGIDVINVVAPGAATCYLRSPVESILQQQHHQQQQQYSQPGTPGTSSPQISQSNQTPSPMLQSIQQSPMPNRQSSAVYADACAMRKRQSEEAFADSYDGGASCSSSSTRGEPAVRRPRPNPLNLTAATQFAPTSTAACGPSPIQMKILQNFQMSPLIQHQMYALSSSLFGSSGTSPFINNSSPLSFRSPLTTPRATNLGCSTPQIFQFPPPQSQSGYSAAFQSLISSPQDFFLFNNNNNFFKFPSDPLKTPTMMNLKTPLPVNTETR